MTKRRTRIDSADGRAMVLANLSKEVAPPDHVELTDSDQIYFQNIVAEFAKSEWTEHQLEIASMLARTMADLNVEQTALRAEGYVIVSPKGYPQENPRVRVVKSLSGDLLSFRRSLALHARARSGDNGNVAVTRKREKDAEAKAMSMSCESDLLAKPVCH